MSNQFKRLLNGYLIGQACGWPLIDREFAQLSAYTQFQSTGLFKYVTLLLDPSFCLLRQWIWPGPSSSLPPNDHVVFKSKAYVLWRCSQRPPHAIHHK